MGGGIIVSGKETRLQFSDPIPALKFGQGRIASQIVLEPKLIELIIIERSKFCSQSAKGPDKAKLRFEVIHDETESNLLCKLETLLGFTLRIAQVISC